MVSSALVAASLASTARPKSRKHIGVFPTNVGKETGPSASSGAANVIGLEVGIIRDSRYQQFGIDYPVFLRYLDFR